MTYRVLPDSILSITPLHELYREKMARGALTDLIETNFHRAGFRYPADTLITHASEYFRLREYHPEAKGSLDARHAISAHYATHGLTPDPESIVITASTSESYSIIFAALCTAGDEILIPTPGYPLFEYLIEYAGLSATSYRLNEADEWQPDPDEIESLITADTRLLVLISPNNPTGSVVDQERIARIARVCASHGIAVICDEVFSEFVYDGSLPRPAEHPDLLCFTLNGASKMFASPDLKIAWIAVTGPKEAVEKAVDAIETVNDVFLNCGAFPQSLLPALFRGAHPFIETMRAELRRNRDTLAEWAGSADRVELVTPRGGIHAILRVDDRQARSDETWTYGLLDATGVHVHPGYLYGIERGLTCVVSFLGPNARLADGLGRISGFLGNR